MENYLLANNHHWHKHHFFCQGCGKLLENNEFFVKDDRIVCESCKATIPAAGAETVPEIAERREEDQGADSVQQMQTFGEQPGTKKFYTMRELTTKPYPAGVDLTKREVPIETLRG